MTPLPKRQVLHVISGLGVGGAEKFLSRYIKNSDITAFEHRVLSLSKGGAVKAELETNGVCVYEAPMFKGFPLFAFWRGLFRVVREFRPAITQGWLYRGNWVALLFSRLMGKKRTSLVWNIRHALSNWSKEPKLFKLTVILNKINALKPRCILYNSELSLKQHIEMGFLNKDQRVVPNGFDLDSFSKNESFGLEIRQELGLGNHDFVVGMIGRYDSIKNHNLLLKSVAILQNQGWSGHIVFVGHGVNEKNEDLGPLIEAIPDRSKLHFLGLRQDVHKIINACDLTVSLSFSEAFSNVIGESLACGVPVVATDVGDSRKIVGEAGYIIESNDLSALVQVLQSSAQNTKANLIQLGKLGSLSIMQNYALREIVRQYDELYRGF